MTTHEIEKHPQYDDYDYPTTAPTVQSGHPGHTTKEQDAAIFSLRTQLEQAGYKERLDTLTMLRFLRARKFDVAAAKKMFEDCEKWRKEFGVDDLVRNFEYTEKSKVFEYYPQYYHKTDKASHFDSAILRLLALVDGRPVYIEHLGKIDLPAINKITTDKRMLQNLVVEYEKLADPRLPACSRKSGQLLETCCTVLDLKGVGVTRVPSVYGYLRQTSAVSQNYYPERLGHMYLINAPWGFASVFSVVKGFLDPVTVQKIHVLGSGYQSELLKQVSKENLPEVLGGTCPWQEPEWMKPPKWAQDGAAQPKAEETKPTEAAKPTEVSTAPAPQHGLTGGAEAGAGAGQAPMGA
ncbi:uncharacterized protein KY384_005859 [Bacidia gigantensis]|uniref:uncharacterized protein n=1 Tax=Bacidia gigantensis TaxID=2732470 RepID=UPI001D03BABB|nr:uncharacterized protein KY384_005859 [Bacidia gigantensis]KAG8529224.1 hypothetical protein KY384_005859 [Bacidia gigantensis]